MTGNRRQKPLRGMAVMIGPIPFSQGGQAEITQQGCMANFLPRKVTMKTPQAGLEERMTIKNALSRACEELSMREFPATLDRVNEALASGRGVHGDRLILAPCLLTHRSKEELIAACREILKIIFSLPERIFN